MSRYILFFLLPFLAISCGEIELPQPDKTEQTTDKVDEGKKDDNSSETNEDNQDKSEDENKEVGNEEDGNDKQPSEDLNFGRVCLTADNHILIDDRLHISSEEFANIPSALNEIPTQAFDLAMNYSEGELKDWRIPTLEDVALLQDALAYIESPVYGKEVLPQLNQALEKRGLRGIYYERYLCEGATKTFSFSYGSNVTKAAAKTLYRLRLVRDK